jgi:hypothetical protein
VFRFELKLILQLVPKFTFHGKKALGRATRMAKNQIRIFTGQGSDAINTLIAPPFQQGKFESWKQWHHKLFKKLAFLMQYLKAG